MTNQSVKMFSISVIIREIKSTSHPIRMTMLKRNNRKWQGLPRMWRNWNSHALLAGMQNSMTTVEKSVMAHQKAKNRITIWSGSSIILLGIYPKESRNLKKYLYIHDHNGIIHKSQKVEATQASTNGWVDKQNMLRTRNVLLSNFGKATNADATTWMKFEDITLSDMSESQKDKLMIPLAGGT